MANDKLINVYNSLKKHNNELPDIDTFEKDIQDRDVLLNVYNAIKKRNPQVPDLDTFSSEIGVTLKKKEPTQPSQSQSQPIQAETPSDLQSSVEGTPSGLPSGTSQFPTLEQIRNKPTLNLSQQQVQDIKKTQKPAQQVFDESFSATPQPQQRMTSEILPNQKVVTPQVQQGTPQGIGYSYGNTPSEELGITPQQQAIEKEKFTKFMPQDEVRDNSSLMEEQAKNKDTHLTRAYADKILKLDPTNERASQLKVWSLTQDADNPDAVKEALGYTEKHLKQYPQDTQSRIYYGTQLAQADQEWKALSEFDKVLADKDNLIGNEHGLKQLETALDYKEHIYRFNNKNTEADAVKKELEDVRGKLQPYKDKKQKAYQESIGGLSDFLTKILVPGAAGAEMLVGAGKKLAEGVTGEEEVLKEIEPNVFQKETKELSGTERTAKVLGSVIEGAMGAGGIAPHGAAIFSAIETARLGGANAEAITGALMTPVSTVLNKLGLNAETELGKLGYTVLDLIAFAGAGALLSGGLKGGIKTKADAMKAIESGDVSKESIQKAGTIAEMVAKLKNGETPNEKEIGAIEDLKKITETDVKNAYQALTDKKIEEAQKKLGLSEVPETYLSDKTNETIVKIEKGENVLNEDLKVASQELYDEYKRLEKIKESDTRQQTTEQITKEQEAIGGKIDVLETIASKQLETGEFKTKKDLEQVKPIETEATPEVVVKETPIKPIENENVQEKVQGREEVKPESETTVAEKQITDRKKYEPFDSNAMSLIKLPIEFVEKNQRKEFEVKRGGTQEKEGRIDKAKEFISKEQQSIRPSSIMVQPDKKIMFGDGRHRIVGAKELGAKEAYFEIPATKNQFDEFYDILSSDEITKKLTKEVGDKKIIDLGDNNYLLRDKDYLYRVDEKGNIERTAKDTNIKLEYKSNEISSIIENINKEKESTVAEKTTLETPQEEIKADNLKETLFSKRVQEARQDVPKMFYEATTDKKRIEAADEIVKKHGEDAVFELIKGKESGLSTEDKSFLLSNLTSRLQKERIKADKENNLEKQVELAERDLEYFDEASKISTSGGRGLQSIQHLNEAFGLKGTIIAAAKKSIKEANEQIRSENKSRLDDVKEALNSITEKAVGKEKEAIINAIKEHFGLQDSNKSRSFDEFAKREARKKKTKEEIDALNDEFKNIYNKFRIKGATANALIPYAQALPEILAMTENRVKAGAKNAKEAATQVYEVIKDYITDASVDDIEKFIKEKFDKSKEINAELKKEVNDIYDLTKDHYRSKKGEVIKGKVASLKDKIVEKLNLSEEDAQLLETKISDKINELTAKDKERAKKSFLTIKEKAGERANKLEEELKKLEKKEKDSKKYGEDLTDLEKARKKILEKTLTIIGNKKEGRTGNRFMDDIINASNKGLLSEKDIADKFSEKYDIPEISREQMIEIDKKAQEIQKNVSEKFRTREYAKLLKSVGKENKLGDYATAYWYANILSSPLTHLLNASTVLFGKVPLYVLREGIKSVGENNGNLLKAAKDVALMIQSSEAGFRKGFTDFKYVMKTGDIDSQFSKIQEGRARLSDIKPTNIVKKAISKMDYVSRLLSATDMLTSALPREMAMTREFSKEFAGENLKYSQLKLKIDKKLQRLDSRVKAARKIAEKQGFKGNEINVRADEILNERIPENIKQKGKEVGIEETYNQDPEGFLGLVSEGIAKMSATVPGLRLVVPFTRIVANVTNDALNYTPIFGIKRALFGTTKAGGNITDMFRTNKMSAEKIQEVKIKTMIGTSAMIAAVVLDKAGIITITSGLSPDADKAKQQRDAGIKPYSINVGGLSFSYQYTPLQLAFTIVGSMKDYDRYVKDGDDKKAKDMFDRIKYMSAAFASSFTNQSFLSSIGKFFDIISGSDPNKLSRSASQFFGNIAGGAIPMSGTVRYVNNILDPTKYETKDLKSYMLNNIPIVRSYALKPALNVFGDEVKGDWSENALKSFLAIHKDGVLGDIAERNLKIPGIDQFSKDFYMNGLPMTDDMNYKYGKIRGQMLKKVLTKNQEYLKKLSDDDARKFISEQASQVNKAAKGVMKITKEDEKKQREEWKHKVVKASRMIEEGNKIRQQSEIEDSESENKEE